jgi:hypothetical protein
VSLILSGSALSDGAPHQREATAIREVAVESDPVNRPALARSDSPAQRQGGAKHFVQRRAPADDDSLRVTAIRIRRLVAKERLRRHRRTEGPSSSDLVNPGESSCAIRRYSRIGRLTDEREDLKTDARPKGRLGRQQHGP